MAPFSWLMIPFEDVRQKNAKSAFDLAPVAFGHVVQVLRGAMELLRAQDQVQVWKPVNQFAAATLGHATHDPQDDMGPVPSGLRDQVLHFTERLGLRAIPDAARVEQNDVRGRFGGGQAIPFRDELSGNCFGVALIHLASVGFDENTGHVSIMAGKVSQQDAFEK